MNQTTDNLELVIVRTFMASIEQVWRAWTVNEEMLKWSCPKGFVITFGELDASIGGVFRSGMKSPDGEVFVVRGVYKEIEEPTRIVMTHGWENEDGVVNTETLIEVNFEERDGKTVMTFRQTGFESIESRDGHEEGWTETFDKLTALLSK